ncbi:MAG: dienelactone hydrolase family protein [Sulfuricaulis sp.]
MKRLFLGLLLSLVAFPAFAAIKGEEVTYRAGDTALKGYIVYDDAAKGKRPGVLVIHEWWGHDNYARERARALARLGYTAFAADMYGNGKTVDHPDQAGAAMAALLGDARTLRTRFDAALSFLKKHKTTDAQRIAAVGYSMGGVIVTQMARDGVDIAGVANFYGMLDTKNPAKPGKVKARILVLNGTDDPLVPPAAVEAFKKEMDAAKADYKFVNYPGAKHCFTNPGSDALAAKFKLPFAYNAEADKKSWEELRVFLGRVIPTSAAGAN